MRALLLTAVAATACAPAEFDCPRTFHRPPDPRGLVVAGYDVRLLAVSPLSTCVSDALHATAEAFDEENRPVPVTLEPVTRDAEARAVTQVTLRPTRPGVYLVRVAFEPSLGVHQLLVPVADVARVIDGPTPPTWRLERCHGGPWPVDDDTLACERRDAGVVELLPRDGRVETFEGEFLVVADAVLWSLTPQGALQRRVWRDGGLALTAELDGFLRHDTAALHGARLAGRWRADGRFAVVTGEAVLSLHETPQRYAPPPSFAVPHGDGGVWFFWGDRTPCVGGSCFGLHGHAGVEAGYLWLQPPLRVVDAALLPVGREFTGLTAGPLAPSAEGFVRAPPVTQLPAHGLVAVGLVRDGTPVFVALELERLQRVGLSRVTALGADGGLVLWGL